MFCSASLVLARPLVLVETFQIFPQTIRSNSQPTVGRVSLNMCPGSEAEGWVLMHMIDLLHSLILLWFPVNMVFVTPEAGFVTPEAFRANLHVPRLFKTSVNESLISERALRQFKAAPSSQYCKRSLSHSEVRRSSSPSSSTAMV